MQTINTKYSNGKITAKSWNGSSRVSYDYSLSAEKNHRVAAETLIAKLNKNVNISWGIHASAQAIGDGWTFIIKHVPEVTPLNMSITVAFKPATNSRPAYMKAYSWLFPKGVSVNYGSDENIDWHSVTECAKYAAGVMLHKINNECINSGMSGYCLSEYGELYNGDRVFMLSE